MSAVSYWVPCRVSAKVTLSDAGQARVEECVQRVIDRDQVSEREARHRVLVDIVNWFGARGCRPSNTDGFADLNDDDITVGADEWETAWVSDVEVVAS